MSKKMFKVLTPVENEKTKKTYWMKLGVAFENSDSSINVHMDAFPKNGRIQLRDWDEDDRREGAGDRGSRPGFAPPTEPTNGTPPY